MTGRVGTAGLNIIANDKEREKWKINVYITEAQKGHPLQLTFHSVLTFSILYYSISYYSADSRQCAPLGMRYVGVNVNKPVGYT